MSKNKGNLSENTACTILIRIGFTILERNYLTRYGEIDIIALKNNVIHFIEVKSTFGLYNPADNFNKTKLKRILRTLKIYCYKHGISPDDTQIDLLLVNNQKRVCNLIDHANLYFH